jgi:beta-glucosidase
LQAIREKAANSLVDYEPGGDVSAASHLAAISDVAIVFAHQWAAEGWDLPNLSLPDNQDELIRQVAKANPRTIVVLENGGPVLMPWLDNVAAVVEAWYPGSGGGKAIANVLFGDINPSGKLPITFPESENDLPRPIIPHPPMAGDQRLSGPPGDFDVRYTEGREVGYKWYDAERKPVLFPFGFGLSYAVFNYSDLTARADSVGDVVIKFKIQNSSTRNGTEVAEIYASLPDSAGEPPQRLVGWKRVELAPGEARNVTVSIERKNLCVFDVQSNSWKFIPGVYMLHVGGSSRDLPLDARIKLQ